MNNVLTALLASAITAGAAVSAVYIYPPHVDVPPPIVQQAPPPAPAVDEERLAALISAELMRSQNEKEAAARSNANDEWCKRMPELESCRQRK